MRCGRVYDFIRGTEIVLPPVKPETAEVQRFDILHPGADEAALVSEHLERLAAVRRPRDRAKTRCAR